MGEDLEDGSSRHWKQIECVMISIKTDPGFNQVSMDEVD